MAILEGQEMVEAAIKLAVQYHAGQKDKNRSPYVLHPLRVMQRFRLPTEMASAVLHDILEDTLMTPERLADEGMSDAVILTVLTLTRRPDETYKNYIERVRRDGPTPTCIKIADVLDNLETWRMLEAGPEHWSLHKRYMWTLDYLQARLFNNVRASRG